MQYFKETKNLQKKGGENLVMKRTNHKENGITLIALIITIIILVILAAVSVRAVYEMGIVNHAVNGTQQYAQKAVEENQMLGDTTNLIDNALENLNKIYNNEEEPSVSMDSLRLEFRNIQGGLAIYPQTNKYDEEYYETLTEYAILSQNAIAILDGYIDEGTTWSSITDVINYWYMSEFILSTSYTTLKEVYESEKADEFVNCWKMLRDRQVFDYIWYVQLGHSSEDDGYWEYSDEMDYQIYSLLPEEYYITITCNEETKRINLATTDHAEFEISVKGNYPVHAIDNQDNSEADIVAKVLPSFTISGSIDIFFFESGMDWSTWVNSPYCNGNFQIFADNYSSAPAAYRGIELVWYRGWPVCNETETVLPDSPIVENEVYGFIQW